MRGSQGFTLTELIIVIVVLGIMGALLAPVITGPVESYFDTARRAEIVYSADAAMRRVARDARKSLPYSVRITNGGNSFEMIKVVDVARYRENGGQADRRLTFNGNDDQFNVIGVFPTLSATFTPTSGERLVVFNLGSGGFDAYAGDPVVTAANSFQLSTESYTVGGSPTYTEHKVTSTGADFPFPVSSPSHRVFIIDNYISYGCTGGGLFRLEGYATPDPNLATLSGGSLETDNISSCNFSYDPGSSLKPGVLTLKLTLTIAGESVTLQHQVHVPNAT